MLLSQAKLWARYTTVREVRADQNHLMDDTQSCDRQGWSNVANRPYTNTSSTIWTLLNFTELERIWSRLKAHPFMSGLHKWNGLGK